MPYVGKKIYVAEQHHEVLPAWAQLRCKLQEAPAVFTIDHHTDVLPAFFHACEGDEVMRKRLLGEFDYTSEESVESALGKLRHDEHIDLALRGGVIGESLIVAHENCTQLAHEAMRVYVPPGWPDMQTMLNDGEKFRPYADRMLESETLSGADFRGIEGGGWILDIDMDGLLTERALYPEDGEYFKKLWNGSLLVTISLERDWVKLLRLPGERLDADGMLEILLKNYA